jgi:hypothetical protein
MHMHGIQTDPNFQMNCIYAAARAEAQREAARTREKLRSAASSLAGSIDGEEDAVVRLAGRGDSQEEQEQHDGESETGEQRQNERVSNGTDDDSFSGWA